MDAPAVWPVRQFWSNFMPIPADATAFASDEPLNREMQQALISTLAEETLKLLIANHYTLAAAESCTGGLFLATLTAISGSSEAVTGGVVCYSNAIKEDWVGVSAETLQQYGAVSRQTAHELAVNIRARMNSTLGVSITGIAGPNGGSDDKPVGLVYIGLATPDGVEVAGAVWDQDREGNRVLSVEQALQMVIAYCLKDA
jgi:nicotinamide-nucleotide amidase